MNLNEIQDLIKLVSKSGLTEVEIEKKDFKITLKADKSRSSDQPIFVQSAPVAAPLVSTPVAAPVVAPAAQPTSEKPVSTSEDSKLITIKSPMIGTFYRSSGPDKDPFVSVGNSVQKGDKVCIIEAMKLFNEIESEVSGKIVKVLIDDASPVEYDQPLFLVEPA
jgi:acetyl-CoA carboxylase biotin carboxyl carrier protein